MKILIALIFSTSLLLGGCVSYHDDYHHGNPHGCPPGQAKKGRCWNY